MINVYKFILKILVFLTVTGLFAEPKIDISGTVEWDTMRLRADISLDLASANIKLPSGRTQGESILSAGYLNLIRAGILDILVDSSSTIGDLVARGEISLYEAETIALNAQAVPPALSPDMQKMYASYTINLSGVSSVLLKNDRPSPITRTLNPVSSAEYSGIIIIAQQDLPVYAMKGTAHLVPCLFPKVWDSEMNLIYNRNMLESHDTPMVRYMPLMDIFQNNPSGLSAELREFAGERPLRIFARGVFGINPTDLIIDREDALLIISSEANRRLLSQGKVAIILDDSVMKRDF
jgi:hypothetical protein